ncbi:MAG: LacI family transcriptional regulator [Bacteroidetes bacterium]|nr:LacI family transcriptional regulator [Bacteroidota bacterium]
MANPTIKDVAKAANVSIATVSLVIHNHKRISMETKQKVLDAITALNYHPSRSARGLVSRKTGNIGFILTHDHFLRTEPFYTQIFMGTEFEARENELYVLLTTIDSNFHEGDSLPRFILERNVDGMIIAGKVPSLLIDKLSNYNIPIVFVDYSPSNKKVSIVAVDNLHGGMLATQHLVELGHKKIAFIGGDIEHPSINDRFNGYKLALEKASMSLNERLINTEEDYPARINGYNAAKKIFSINKDISAVFACNDAMAVGVIQYLKDIGKQIPNDISVIGFDDVVSENSVNPPLSTIRVPKMEMGVEAMRLISSLVKDHKKIHKKILVNVELVVRQSTKKL